MTDKELAQKLSESLAAGRAASRISNAKNSYKKDNPGEYANVMAYLDGGARPTGTLTKMGQHLVLEEDVRVALAQTQTVEPGIPVPTSIDKTGASDVTVAMQAWIDGVANGSTLRFSGGTYRIDNHLRMTSRTNLTFDLGDATFQWNTPDNDARKLLWFTTCTGITVKNGTLLGTYSYPASGSGYNEGLGLEHMHAIDVDRSQVDVLDMSISGFYGDGVYFGNEAGSGTGVGSGSVRNCDLRKFGRSGISVVAGNGVSITGNHFQQSGLHGVDIEPNDGMTYACKNISVDNNTWGSQVGTTTRPILIILSSSTVPVTDVSITNGTVTGRSADLRINQPFTPATRVARVTISGMSCSTNGSNETWTLKEIDGLNVSGNTIPVSSGVTIGVYNSTAVSISGSTYATH